MQYRLGPPPPEYLNFDRAEDRRILQQKSWSRDVPLVVFDELHKMRKWKSWIKGIYDTEGVRPRLLVTGSAQLETLKKGGDSLAGRFHGHRLHPFSPAEVQSEVPPEEALARILRHGGFPEPFLKDSAVYSARWRRSHLDIILRQDLLDLEQVRDLRAIELLVDLLADRVGTPVAYASLARDLEVSPHTVKKWIGLLANLYVVFLVPPYTRNIARSLLKEPKIYFFDTGRVRDDPGMRLENAVACALLKRQHFLADTRGRRAELHYVRDRQKREVDFLTVLDRAPEFLVEVKVRDPEPARALLHYAPQLAGAKAIQLVQELRREEAHGKVRVLRAASWLAGLEA